ncbi:MAG: lytic transglycosylase domain-containing protein [Spirochaetaceae bacterium]|jgi:soluble lytic murein transglycosylase|nr:lytic transglycosylase domain-containing protein [Spirochaetaceae bacterium]
MGCLSSCGAPPVLGLPAREAVARLERGEIAFILEAGHQELEDLSGFEPAALFYAGLLVQAAETAGEAAGGPGRAAILFTHALESSNSRIQEEAARKLIRELLTGSSPEERALLAERLAGKRGGKLEGKKARAVPILEDLAAAVRYTLGRFGEVEEVYRGRPRLSLWGEALSLLSAAASDKGAGETRERFLAFFLDGPLEEEQRWALGEPDSRRAPCTPAELAAVSGRLSVSRRAYGEALGRFRAVLEQEPDLFPERPELLSDLGRAFLYAGSAARKEGERLFRQWEEALGEPVSAGSRETRFRLSYYRGRFLRQEERYAEAAELFTRALAFAPEGLQEDACIWYILSTTEEADPSRLAGLLKTYAPRWHEDRSFADIYDRLSRRLVINREWGTFLEVFPLVRAGSDGAATAQYAYIIGRAVTEGYIPAGAAGALLEASGGVPLFDEERPDGGYQEQVARAYFRIAFEAGQASFYYRVLSAARLGKAVVPGSASAAVSRGGGEDMAFLLDFFRYGAASYAFPYIQKVMEDLTIRDLRLLAEAFAGAGLWGESIRISAAYMAREDYELTRRDMELSFPRPYAEIIEGSAREEDLPPEILFGLIRTESAFAADAVSRVGASGLTQLMPATAQDMARRIKGQGGPDYAEAGELDLGDPRINVPLGARYLRYLWDRAGSPVLALTAYNGGMGRLPRWRAAAGELREDLFLETIEYPETRNYGKKVLSAAAVYGYLYYGMSMEAVLADILR